MDVEVTQDDGRTSGREISHPRPEESVNEKMYWKEEENVSWLPGFLLLL